MIKNRKESIKFLIIFGITCIIFIPFLMGHYSADTYKIYNIGYKEAAIGSLKDGRIAMAIIGLMAWKTNISIEGYVFATLLIALCISDLIVIKLNIIIKRYKQPKNIVQEVLLTSICFITIFNFTYLENMFFVESIVMATSIFLYMIAADSLVQKSEKHFIISIIMITLGVLCYQGTIGMFITFLILFTVLKNKNNLKQIIRDLLKGATICCIAVLLNIVFIKFIGKIFNEVSYRSGNISDIFYNIKVIIKTMLYILQNTCNLFPKNLLLLLLLSLTVIVLIYQLKNNNKENKIWYKYLTIVFITIAGSNITFLITLSSFFTGRVRNALGALIGIIFILLYVETTLLEKKGILKSLTYSIIILYIIVTITNYEKIMVQLKQINKLEKQEVEEIDKYIKQYEKDNEIVITNLVKVMYLNSPNKHTLKKYHLLHIML